MNLYLIPNLVSIHYQFTLVYFQLTLSLFLIKS